MPLLGRKIDGDGARIDIAISFAVLDDGSAGNHCQQGLRDHQGETNVHDQEQNDRRHAEEMHEPCSLKIIEQPCQLRKLHRLPD
jgi:hypothetical protein